MSLCDCGRGAGRGPRWACPSNCHEVDGAPSPSLWSHPFEVGTRGRACRSAARPAPAWDSLSCSPKQTERAPGTGQNRAVCPGSAGLWAGTVSDVPGGHCQEQRGGVGWRRCLLTFGVDVGGRGTWGREGQAPCPCGPVKEHRHAVAQARVQMHRPRRRLRPPARSLPTWSARLHLRLHTVMHSPPAWVPCISSTTWATCGGT